MALSAAARPLARTGGRLFALWLRSLRVRVLHADGTSVRRANFVTGRSIYALSERDLLALASLGEGRNVAVLVDEGNDGDWAVELASALGCKFVRGSSLHHGLAAVRAMIAALESSDGPAVMVVDGPVGPAGEAKAGVAACAAFTGRPIVPVAAAAKWRIVFPRSWAGHYLPLPGSRVSVAVGAPVTVDRGTPRTEWDAVARTITIRLRELRERAEHELEVRAMPAESKLA